MLPSLVVGQDMSRTQLDEGIDAVESFTITEFKERAREVIDLVEDHKAVVILRHKMPDAVLISASDYVEFMKLRRERLNFLTQRYDEMVARMQTPDAVAGVDALFNASSEELGSAAIAAAKRA
jgi:antitoxin Phd